MATEAGFRSNFNPHSRSHTGKYLFSGLIQCGCCGANYTVYSTTSYACATNINRGDAACGNRLRIPRKVLEGSLLDVIRKELLSEEAIAVFMQETTLALKQKQSEQKPEHDVHKRSLAKAEQQIANIMAAIQAGIITPTTKEALIRAEAEHKYAENQLKESSQAVEILTTLLPSAAERYSAIVSNLSQSLYTDVAQARQCLKELMGQIRLVPSANGYLDAELRPTPKDS